MTHLTIDTTHSEIAFRVRHMMFAKVRGQFDAWSAEVTYDPADPTRSVIEVVVDVASIDTHEPKRDAHLRSDDFFAAERFPKMVFRSSRVEAKGEGRYALTGELTLRGVTRPLTLEVEQTVAGTDPWGNQRLGFAARGSLSRSEWGLTWNQALEAGGLLVSDKVELEIEVQALVAARQAA